MQKIVRRKITIRVRTVVFVTLASLLQGCGDVLAKHMPGERGSANEITDGLVVL